MADLIYKDEAYAVIGACFEVYKDKGCGFLEPVYQECLAIELEHRGITFVAQEQLNLFYRDRKLTSFYKPDFICFGKIVVEVKAVSKLIAEHRAQTMNYLKATGYGLGLLINFGHFPGIEHERIASTVSSRLSISSADSVQSNKI